MFYELRAMIDVALADGFLTVVQGTVDIHFCMCVHACNSSGESLTTAFYRDRLE